MVQGIHIDLIPGGGGSPLGDDVVRLGHDGDELGVSHLIIRVELSVGKAADESLFHRGADIGIGPMGGGNIREGTGRKGRQDACGHHGQRTNYRRQLSCADIEHRTFSPFLWYF